MLTFSIAVSALRAAFERQAITANNVANVFSPAYQARRAHQVESFGGGTEINAVRRDESQGGLSATGRALDLAVSGQGYLAVDTPRGMRYTRVGSFGVDAGGNIVDPAGNRLAPGFTVPPEAVAVEVSRSGEIAATMPDGSRQVLGQVSLYTFANPGGLEAVGGGLFSPTAASGPAQPGTPGADGYGEVVAGFLEGSNVDLARELTDQIVNRATVRANAASIKAQNDMLGEVLDMKG
jgi:flagellar basal-body rod protein FlgG